MRGRRARRPYLSSLAGLGLAFAGCSPSPDLPRPDLLVVTLDTVRADALEWAPTPTLDRLSSEGWTFEQLVSVGFGTTPSHASLFTASHPVEHGVHDNATPLGSELDTLAEVLSEAGWQTAAFVSSAPVRSRLGLAQGFQHFDESFGPPAHERRAAATIDAFLDWRSERGKEQPLFAWLHLYDPHQPYDPPGPFRVETPASGVESLFRDEDEGPRFVFPEELADRTEPEIREVDRIARERYAGEIAYLDSELGRVVEALEQEGRFDPALVLVVSDHGESFLADGLEVAFRHQELRSSVSRLVGLLKRPGSEGAGGRLPMLIASCDLAPSLLELLGVPSPESWPGKSFVPWLDPARREPFRELVVLEGSDPPLVAVRTPGWLLVEPREEALAEGWSVEITHQLFDLRSDPAEAQNLYGQRPELTDRLHRVAQSFLSEGAAIVREPLADEDHLEALRSLGYLQ